MTCSSTGTFTFVTWELLMLQAYQQLAQESGPGRPSLRTHDDEDQAESSALQDEPDSVSP